MTTGTSISELLSVRARCASLESRLKEEVAAHAGTKALLEDRVGNGEDEDTLGLILWNMPVMMNAFDEDGVCVAWNAECERVLGFSAEEMVGNPRVMELLLPDPAYRAAMTAEWAGKGDHRDWEWEHTAKDGRQITVAWSNISDSFPVQGWTTWGIGVDLTERTRALELLQTARRELEDRVETFKKLLLTGRPHHFEAGVVRSGHEFRIGTSRVGVTTHDVTDRVPAEQAIRNKESEVGMPQEMFSGFMDAAGDGFAILDRELRFVDINREGVKNLRLPKSEVVGRTYLEVLETSGRKNLAGLEACAEVFRTGKIVKFEGSATQKPNGRTHWLTCQAFPIGTDQVGMIISNTTERAEVERALRESEARYRDMVESISDRVWELDADLRVTSFKGDGAHWASKWIGKHPWDLNEGIPQWRELMEILKAHRPYRDFLLTVPLDDGTICHSRSSGKPLFDEAGNFAGYRGITVDETEKKEAELRAQEAQALLQEAICVLPDGFIIYDSNQKLVGCNDAYRELHQEIKELLVPGTPRAELWGAFARANAPNISDEKIDEMLEAAESGSLFFAEHVENQRKDGRWVRSVDRRLPDGSVVGIRTDITDLKRREAEVRKSKEILSGFMDSATESFSIFDHELNYVDVNRATARHIGLPRDEIVGRNMFDFRPEAKSSGRAAAYLEVLRTGDAHKFEISLTRRSTGKPEHLSGTAFRIGEGLLGMTSHDITDQVETARALQESEERFRDVAETSSDWIWEVDADNRHIYTSERIYETLGIRPEEQIGTVLGSGELFLDRDTENWKQLLETMKARRPFTGYAFRSLGPNGDVRTIETSGKPVFDAKGVFRGYRGVCSDITDRQRALDALKESEQRLLESQRIARIGTFEHDLVTGKIVWTDEAFRLLGYEPGEIEPSLDAYMERLHPDDRDLVLKARAAIKKGERPVDDFRRFIWRDGSVHALATVASLQYDECGRPIRVTRTMQDITERVQADDRLRDSSNALAAAQRIASIGSWRWDIDTDEIFWSDEHYVISGLERGEVDRLDLSFIDTLVHPDDLEEFRGARARTRETGLPFSSDFRIVRPDGEVRHVHSRGELGSAENGRHVVGTLQDVTDRVQAQEDLRRSQSIFERAFESSPGLAYIVSLPDNRLLKVNDAWCKRLGYKREEVIGRTTSEIAFWIDDEARKREVRAEFARTAAIQPFPTMLRSAKGETIHVELSADALEFEGGKAVFTIAHDRTERKAFEDALWKAKESAELANRTKSEFLANVSHELRTPLNAILGFSEMMSSGLAGPLTDKQSDYLSDIFASGELLLGLIGDVIDVSTIELGKLKLFIGSVDLHECVEDCVTQLKNRIDELGLRLRVGDLSALPFINADKRRIKQVIINLLSNAVKFTDPDGEISIEGVVTGQRECAITVTDTGVGMSKAMVRQALTAFKRGEDPMLRNMEGVGLGLSLVQSMVEAHGGSVAIESTLGKGTTVTVTFPIDGPPKHGTD